MARYPTTPLHDARDKALDAQACHLDIESHIREGKPQDIRRALDNARGHLRDLTRLLEQLCAPTGRKAAAA